MRAGVRRLDTLLVFGQVGGWGLPPLPTAELSSGGPPGL